MEELDLLKHKISNYVDKADYNKYVKNDTDIVRLRRVLREMKKWSKLNPVEKEREINKIYKEFKEKGGVGVLL